MSGKVDMLSVSAFAVEWVNAMYVRSRGSCQAKPSFMGLPTALNIITQGEWCSEPITT